MTVAFFYDRPLILDRGVHRLSTLTPVNNAIHAAKTAAVPLLANEFAEACLEYPIVFVKTPEGGWLALAVTGLGDGENYFVDANGQWTGRYIPASVRRYPLLLSEVGNGQRAVCVDVACGAFSDGSNGLSQAQGAQRLFDDAGEPTPAMQQFMNMLNDFQAKAEATSAFVARLAEAKLLSETNLQINLPDGRSAVLSGVWIVQEAGINSITDSTVASWFRSGDLALLYTHLVSLRNLGYLLSRRPVAAANDGGSSVPAGV